MENQNQSSTAGGFNKNAAPDPEKNMNETKYKLNPIRFALTKFTIYETKSVRSNLNQKFNYEKKLIFNLLAFLRCRHQLK